MANKVVEKKLVDSSKRTLVKYVVIGDGTNAANTNMLDVSMLRGALNTAGYIMTGNTNPKSSYRSTIKRIFGQCKSNGYFALAWQGAANNEIVTISSGSFDYNFEAMGDGATISNDDPSPTGDIVLTTAGTVSGDVLTLFIDLRKDARDFDAGQNVDPDAFRQRVG